MLDLSPNALTAVILGPLIVAILAAAGWAIRRAFVRQDREIERMEATLKEFGEKLVNVLTEQGQLGVRLEERFTGLSTRMADFQSNANQMHSRIDGVSSEIANMKTDINGMQNNIDGMQRDVDGVRTVLRDHRVYVDEEISNLRKWLNNTGTAGSNRSP